MRITGRSIHYLAQMAFTCTVLFLANPAKVQGQPQIHPSKIHLRHGTVIAARWATPNAVELGASTDVMGRISCFEARIKQTSIYRVETVSHYFDLAKLCGGAGTNVNFWRNYEHLRVGEKLTFQIKTNTELKATDPTSRCRFVNEKDVRRCEELQLRGPAKQYQVHCTCQETYAYVEHGKVNVWRFLVIGNGPRLNAGAAQLRRPWIRFQQGVVTAIGWTRNLHALVGSELSASPLLGHASCNGSDIARVPIYRVIAGSQYFDLEDACDEADLMDLRTDERWGKNVRLKIGQLITFHVEKNPGWNTVKRNTARRIAWVDHGDHVWEFSIAGSGLKSTLPSGPAFEEAGNRGGPSNKCSGVISAPVAIYKPEPPYTAQARKAKKSGTVVVSVLVDAQGNATQEKIVKSLGTGLDKSALATLKTWQFNPAMCDGVPMSMRVKIAVSFQLR